MIQPLLPNRHSAGDWFTCDFNDVIPKSDIASMEHPFFTLSKKPDTKVRDYQYNDVHITIIPSALGLATIHDKDILIYCISQLIAGINRGVTPSRKIVFNAHDLLITTNRPTGGESYKRLEKSFSRLTGTLIETNIKTNNIRIYDKFHILESVKTVYNNLEKKRMVKLEVVLSEWLYHSVLGQDVLSISRDYFRIRKPIERRIYEIARKHCGCSHQKNLWQIGIHKLYKKVGTSSTLRKFKFTLNHIIKHQHLPDYHIRLANNNVVFNYTGKRLANPQKPHSYLKLKNQTIENAKKLVKGHYDVYALEQEWREWAKDKAKPDSPDGAFVNFCKKKMAQV